MEKSPIEQFQNQKYINIETYRKNGVPVKTPVWFVEMDGKLYTRTPENSGKVKRIRNNSQVKVSPCKVDGSLVGTWVTAEAVLVEGISGDKVIHLYRKKYGLQNFFLV